MTHEAKHAPRRAATCPGPRIQSGAGSRAGMPAAAFAALLLAGCSSGHIGESWQCPLAEGGSCDSVAAADPAVPDTAATGNAVLVEPLWRVRTTQPDTAAKPPCASDCGAFEPFAWLARLFATETVEGAPRTDVGSERASAAPAVRTPDPLSGEEADAPAGPPAALPVEAAPAQGGAAADGLRTGEVVARIWIAPFVDANGIYREAGHVRAVLEPATWRLR